MSTETIPPETDTSEIDLAAELGLPRDELIKIRKSDNYRRGHHWDKDGKVIIWLPRGKAQLREELGLSTDPKIGDRAAGRVVSDYCLNQRIIRMVVNGRKLDVICDPQDKPSMRSPMVVPVTYTAGGWVVARSPRV